MSIKGQHSHNKAVGSPPQEWPQQIYGTSTPNPNAMYFHRFAQGPPPGQPQQQMMRASQPMQAPAPNTSYISHIAQPLPQQQMSANASYINHIAQNWQYNGNGITPPGPTGNQTPPPDPPSQFTKMNTSNASYRPQIPPVMVSPGFGQTVGSPGQEHFTQSPPHPLMPQSFQPNVGHVFDVAQSKQTPWQSPTQFSVQNMATASGDRLAPTQSADSEIQMVTDPENIPSIRNDYSYFPAVSSSASTIRLVRLHPGPPESDLVLSLVSEDLVSPHRILYECLSYCWGNIDQTRVVRMRQHDRHDGSEDLAFSVTAGLEAVLRQLRYDNGPRTLWIDAVCIDQSNVKERASQVSLMKEIYSNAAGVIVWLGESDPITLYAFLAIEQLHTHFIRGRESYEVVNYNGFAFDQARLRQLVSYEFTDTTDGPRLTVENVLRALAAFFDRPWFRRIWVLQELSSSPDSAVLCGSSRTSWDAILLAGLWQSHRSPDYLSAGLRSAIQHRDGYLPELWLYLAKRGRSSRLSIAHLVFRAREFRATDPRDKIFALLGMASEALLLKNIPDYSKSKHAVYKDFARWLINYTGTLDVLSAVDTFTPETPSEDEWNEPSHWIPSFEKGIPVVRILGYPQRFSASGTRRAVVQEVAPSDSDKLSLLGFKLDSVQCVTRSVFYQDSTFRILSGAGCNAVRDIWRTISKLPRSSADDLLSAFVLTLTCVGFADPNEPFPDSVPGTILPAWRMPSLSAHFAAYWARFDPSFSELPTTYRAKLAEVARQGDANYFGFLAGKACNDRLFCVTKGGYIGLCPRRTQEGDVIAILNGGSVPYVVRPIRSYLTAADTQNLEFVGECYIHGRMDGSALEDSKKRGVREQLFHLW